MKKLLVALLVLLLSTLVLFGCDNLGGNKPDPQPHEHEFTLINQMPPTCLGAGERQYKCDCGQFKTEVDPAKGHTFEVSETIAPTCLKGGLIKYACVCGETKEEAGDPAKGHTFEVSETIAPACLKDGLIKYACVCGETKEEAGDPATGHDYQLVSYDPETCYSKGFKLEKCSNCSSYQSQYLDATGEHSYVLGLEASRIDHCMTPGCTSVRARDINGKYTEQIKYVFAESDLDRFYATHEELGALIDAADLYDPELHAYDTTSDVYAQYLVMEAKYDELYEFIEYVVSQYQIAQIEYHMVMNSEGSEEAEANFDYISKIRTDLIAQFYIFSEPIYNSMYREYYYYGMTEQEIMAFIFDSSAVSNPEYKELSDRNSEIELEYNSIAGPARSEEVPILYAEFVENNNKIARLMGYENYLEYAYENVYDRDYSYQDVAVVADYVKEYLAPLFIIFNNRWSALRSSSDLTQSDIDMYNAVNSASFFENFDANDLLNDYIDLLEFNSNPDKKMSFSDEFNALHSDGNLFRGKYDGAYVTSLYGINTPIAYFGPGYDSSFTVAHEFGHYMNEKYSGGVYSQSYDLLEMHSQGNEMIYLAYLKGQIKSKAHELVETYNILVMLNTIVTALCVDTFEQAVYTDFYDGAYADQIMLDGTITSDEYDLLFNSVLADFGVAGFVNDYYWRLVTIHAPCYYVSYSISAISVLQLYPMAQEDFDAGKDAYLKLFTYVDTYENGGEYMDTEATLVYAGLKSFTDEELYKYIYEELYH